jgi:hypothetical protein
MLRPVCRTRRHGRRDGRDRGPIRKQREAIDARRADRSLTGVFQSALECRGKRGAGKAQEKLCMLACRRFIMHDFGGILLIFWMLKGKIPQVGQPAQV